MIYITEFIHVRQLSRLFKHTRHPGIPRPYSSANHASITLQSSPLVQLAKKTL